MPIFVNKWVKKERPKLETVLTSHIKVGKWVKKEAKPPLPPPPPPPKPKPKSDAPVMRKYMKSEYFKHMLSIEKHKKSGYGLDTTTGKHKKSTYFKEFLET